jgi:hypothetical protein
MSNLIVNIRFWYRHLQIERGFRSISFGKNKYFKNLEGVKKIEVLKFFWYSK